MAIAKAFATGQRPKRSLLFVWHTGEEAGLYGSRYMADYPVVPLDKVAAQLNIDMVGRNQCDDPAKANTLFLVGSDRISSELHNLNEEANASQPMPLTLDYDLNDIADTESLYTRSDHYSYAAKGIPIIFFTHRAASRLSLRHRRSGQDHLPEDAAGRAARLHDGDPRRQSRSPSRPRQQGTPRRHGADRQNQVSRADGR